MESMGKYGKVWASIENKVDEGWIRLDFRTVSHTFTICRICLHVFECV